MAEVQTVKGPVDVAGLGPTLMHEHIFALSPEIQANDPELWDENAGVDDGIARPNELAGAGISSILDLTVVVKQ